MYWAFTATRYFSREQLKEEKKLSKFINRMMTKSSEGFKSKRS